MWHNELWMTSAHASALQWSHNVLNHQPHDCLLNLYSDADQRKYQSSASLAFMRGIHRGPVNSWFKWPVTRKMFPFRQWRLRNSVVEVSHAANRNNAANFTKNSPPVDPHGHTWSFVWQMLFFADTHVNNNQWVPHHTKYSRGDIDVYNKTYFQAFGTRSSYNTSCGMTKQWAVD